MEQRTSVKEWAITGGVLLLFLGALWNIITRDVAASRPDKYQEVIDSNLELQGGFEENVIAQRFLGDLIIELDRRIKILEGE